MEPLPPGHLAARLHRHAREDEYSYVLEGRLGAQLGDDVVVAQAGDLVFKPRDQWHTFWNAGDGVCRILEIISPAGFEHFFDDLASGSRPASRTPATAPRSTPTAWPPVPPARPALPDRWLTARS